MKRKLSLLLAVVMILGSFSFAFAADEVVPAEFLEKEGILVGNDSGDLMLDQPLLRKDAVVLLARLMKAEEEAEAFEKEGLPTFNDLADNPYYKGFLAWAEDNGYFTGKTDGSFGYTDNLEAVEYALVLLRALGYVNDNKADEWDNAWTEAEKLGLLEDVKAERRDEIKREEVAQMTFNALGVTMKDSDKTLAEFLGIKMPEAGELTATVKDTENLKEVVVELSNAKLADKDKLENANNYKVAGNVVEKAELDGNNVIVLLKNPLLEGREYKLRIRSIDKAINAEYKFVARDNTLPRVEEVEVLGEYGIKVVTNEPINIKDGNRGRNFLVDGKNIAMNVESYGRNIILTPYYKESFSENSKTLTITGLEDFAGFKSAREEFEIDVVKDEVAPEVVDVILRGSNKVEVVFDKDIYIESVEAYNDRNNTGNISYESGRHNVYADDAEKVDTNRVVYTFEDDLLRRRTEFTIEGVQNHSKVTMERTTMEAREVLDDTEPEIIDHKVVEKDVDNGTAKIKLYFDKDVEGNFDGDSDRYFEPNKHFTLYEREVYKRNISEDGKVDKAYYDTDGDKLVKDVIVVELIGLEGWTSTNELDYILEVEDFTDATSKRNRMYRDYVEFRITKSTGFTIEDIDVVERTYETEITIKFSKAVDRVIAEDPTNYIFTNNKGARRDVKDLKGEIVTERRGKEVTLILPDFEVKDYKELRILDVLKDKDGNRLDAVYTYDFESKTVNGNEYTLSKNDDGDYVVTPKADKITLKTDLKGKFIVEGNLDKLTIDAPNAHVVIEGNVGEVEVIAIGGNSLEIESAASVGKLVVSTKDAVRVLGNVKNMVITSTVEEATVNLVDGEELVEIKIEKGKKVEFDEEGKVIPETVKVEIEGTAVKDTDYTVTGLEADTEGGYKPVKRGATVKITAKNDIVVNEIEISAGLSKEIVVNEDVKITIDKVEDTIAPKIVSATAEKVDGNLILTVEANDEGGLYSLEVDHSLGAPGDGSEGQLPEFHVYASEENPYGTGELETAFTTAGVSVTYESGRWAINFGSNITGHIEENGGIDFYLVVHDEAGNSSGDMNGNYKVVSYKAGN